MFHILKDIYVLVEHTFPRLAKLARFAISGGTGAVVNIGVLILFTHVFDVWYLLSSVISFVLATGVSFMFQKFWTFKDASRDRVRRQMTMFFVVALMNLGFNTLFMYLFVDVVGLHYVLSQVAASLLIAAESYFIYRKIFNRAILVQ